MLRKYSICGEFAAPKFSADISIEMPGRW